MNEVITSELVKPPLVVEVRYPGHHVAIREITSRDRDTRSVNDIHTSLFENNPDEYDQIKPETPVDTRNWLIGGVTRHFDAIRLGSPRAAAIGIEEGTWVPSGELIIATKPVTEAEKITDYTYIYRADVDSSISAKTQLELSYVTATPDADRDADKMADAIRQTTMMLYEKSLGRTVSGLTGAMTEEEQAKAESELSFIANANASESEANYRKALELAGFEAHAQSTEDGQDYITYKLSLPKLLQEMKKEQSGQE